MTAQGGPAATPYAPPPGGGRSFFGPELVAGILSIATVAVVAVAVLGGGGPVVAVNPPSAAPSASGTTAPVDLGDVVLLTTALQFDSRLLALGDALAQEVQAASFSVGDVRDALNGINALILAATIDERLKDTPSTAVLGAELSDAYGNLGKLLKDTQNLSLTNAAAWKAAANAVLKALAGLKLVDDHLRAAIADDTLPSVAPSLTPPAPSPASPAPTAPPAGNTPAPSLEPSAVPSAAPSGQPLGLVNPGFEAGTGAPWQLLVTPPASATITADTTVHHGGTASARVDITVAGDERAGIELRQGGMPVVAGSDYQASVWVRAAGPREVRLRIASAAGDTYATRLCDVGPVWSQCLLQATVFADDPAAYFELDLGRFTDTTWVDDATFDRLGPSAN